MRITRAQLNGDEDYRATIDISARKYWQDLTLYPPSMRQQRIKELEHAAEKLPYGGAARLLRSLERQGYLR
jgi:hypothetical protein